MPHPRVSDSVGLGGAWQYASDKVPGDPCCWLQSTPGEPLVVFIFRLHVELFSGNTIMHFSVWAGKSQVEMGIPQMFNTPA